MELSFFLGVYQDQKLAQRLILEIRDFYPFADILCCADGASDRDFEAFCTHYKVCYSTGERLKLAQFGGAWVARMLEMFLESSQALMLIKLDPDSRVLRPFHTLPTADLAGNIRLGAFRYYLQGGCIAIRRSACQRILVSSLLNNPLYRSFAYSRYFPPYLQPGEVQRGEKLIAADLILSHVSQALGMQWQEWEEVCSFPVVGDLENVIAQFDPGSLKERFAVIHPWKHE